MDFSHYTLGDFLRMETQRQGQALVDFSSPWRETGRKDALRRHWLMLDRVKVWDRPHGDGGNGNLWISLFLIETRADHRFISTLPLLTGPGAQPQGALERGAKLQEMAQAPPPQPVEPKVLQRMGVQGIQTPETDPVRRAPDTGSKHGHRFWMLTAHLGNLNWARAEADQVEIRRREEAAGAGQRSLSQTELASSHHYRTTLPVQFKVGRTLGAQIWGDTQCRKVCINTPAMRWASMARPHQHQ